MGFLVDWEGDFIGRDALLAQRESGAQRKLVNLHCDGELPGLLIPHQPVFADGDVVGSIRVGGYGHTIDRTIALAYLPIDVLEGGARMELGVQGERYPVEMTTQALFDPRNRRVRG